MPLSDSDKEHYTQEVSQIGMQAGIEAISVLLEIIAKKVGIEAVDGLAVGDWLYREKRIRAREALISIENVSQEVAAFMQGLLDEIDKRTGVHPPEDGPDSN
jgi:hypothetical protein